MTLPAGLLLSALGSVGRSLFGASGGGGAARGVGSEEAAFEALLKRTEAGLLRSGRGVEVAPGAGVSLSAEDLERIAMATDRLEAAGAQRGVVLLEHRALVVEVATRRVVGEIGAAEGKAVTGIDGILRAPPADGPGEAGAGGVALPARTAAGASPSLLEVMERAERSGEIARGA